MNKTIHLALIGASILALTSPVLARGVAKGDLVSSLHGSYQAMREIALEQAKNLQKTASR